MKPVEIPNYQDEPTFIIIWPVDELIPFMMCASLGFLFHQLILTTVFSYIVLRIYRKTKENQPKGFLIHWLYSKGVFFSNSKTMKNAFYKRFIPE